MTQTAKGTQYTISVQGGKLEEHEGRSVRTEHYTIVVVKEGSRVGTISMSITTEDPSDATGLRRLQDFANHLKDIL